MTTIKILSFLFLPFFVSTTLIAQEVDKAPSPVASVLNLPRQFFYFDITQNMWLNTPEGVETKFYSGGLNINFFYEFNLAGSWLGIAPGISYATYGVKSNAIYQYTYTNNPPGILSTSLVLIDDSTITISKMSTSYLEIPLELHFHTKPKGQRNKSFMVAPGFRAGLLINDFWKFRFEDPYAGSTKVKIYGTEYLSKTRLGVSLRLTYYKFGLFGYYQLSNLFEKDKGPEITPLSLGVTLSPF